MHIVLMAGGSGTRFWPRSRASEPKQMLNIVGEQSMLRMTYERIRKMVPDENIIVVTNTALNDKVMQHLPELPKENIIAEPFGRNTAPCIGLASVIIKKRAGEDEVMVVLPADHLIRDDDKFRDAVKVAAEYAENNDCLITMGIQPEYPETGYGYIQLDEEITNIRDRRIYKVKTFAEKPTIEIAQRFLKSGDFLWNSGMFIWKVKAILNNFDEHQPDLYHGICSIMEKADTSQMDEAIYDLYSNTKSISIDYGIMEYAKKVCVLKVEFSWNDIGSWEAVYNISPKDENGNVITAAEKCVLNSKNNFIYTNKKLVATIGLEDIVLVDTKDAILICKRDQSQQVKDLVDQMGRKDLKKYL